MENAKKEYFSVEEISNITQKTKQTIRNWVKKGKLPQDTYRVLYGTDGKILSLLFTKKFFDWLNPERKRTKSLVEAKNKQAKKLLRKLVGK